MAGISVRLNIDDPPTIDVSGQVIRSLNRLELDNLLKGGDNAWDRVHDHFNCKHLDGVHASNDDGLPSKLHGTFTKYGWTPVQHILKAKSAKIVSISAEPVIVADQLASNPSTVADSEVWAEIATEVVNSFSKEASWDVSSTIEQTVSYEVGGDAVGGKIGGSTSISFSAGYGESKTKENSVAVGSSGGVKAVLEPGEAVLFQLSMTLGEIYAQVEYEGKLQGGLMARFGKRCNGHYLYYVPLHKLYPRKDLVKIMREDLRTRAYNHQRITQSDPPAGWEDKV